MPEDDPQALLPVLDRWLNQLGRGFEIEHLIDQGALGGSRLIRLDEVVHALVGDDLAPARFRQLPIAVLGQLAAIGHTDYADVAKTATMVLNSLTRDRAKGNLPVTLAAKLVANRLGAGTHGTAQMVRLIEKLGISGAVPDDHATRQALAQLCNSCTTRYHDVNEIGSSLNTFAQASGLGGYWHQVENAVLHARFVWPLLVWTATDRGTSLPLQIRLYYNEDSTGAVRLRAYGKVFHDPGLMASSTKARKAAIDFWQNINRSRPKEIRDQVELANLVIDLTWFQEVRRRAGEDIASLPVTWESFEASLALSIFAALVDPGALEGVCATGTIGDPEGYDGHDRAIGQVRGVETKLARMAAMRFVDRGLYPAANTEVNPAVLDLPPHLGVRKEETFSAYVRATMLRDGSSHDFVRCPDLEIAWRDRALGGPEVGEALDLIRQGGSVVEMPTGTAPQDVIRALRAQNKALRLHSRHYRAAHPETNLEEKDFLQSFTVIRATPYETNERFWRVLWDLLDGTETEWSKFTRAVSHWAPAVQLASLLHRRLTPGRLRRVPDRVVIVGARHLSNNQNLCPNGPFKRLQLDALKGPLAKILAERDPLSPHRAAVLGPARLILVPDDGLAERPAFSTTDLEKELRGPFQQLAIFKHDFTTDAAKLMLDRDDHDTRTILHRLGGVQLADGTPIAVQIGRDGTDSWMLNAQPKETGSAAVQRDLHLAAAEALVGFRASTQVRFADYRRALAPAVVHDAQHHLALAERFSKEVVEKAGARTSTTATINVSVRNAITNAKVRLSLLAEPFSWTTVRWAAAQRGEADASMLEAAIEYLNEVRNDPKRREGRWAHPLEIAALMRLIGVRILRIHKSIHDAAETARLLHLLDDLRNAGIGLCALFDGELFSDGIKEGDACRFAVLSTYLAVQMDLDPSWARAQAFKVDFKLAANLAYAAREVPDPRFFVYLGDYEKKPHIAALHYKRGFFEDQGVVAIKERRNAEVLLKYLGAALQADFAEVTDALLEQVKRETPAGMTNYIALNVQPGFGIQDSVANERWTIGRTFFQAGFRSSRARTKHA